MQCRSAFSVPNFFFFILKERQKRELTFWLFWSRKMRARNEILCELFLLLGVLLLLLFSTSYVKLYWKEIKRALHTVVVIKLN